MKDHRLLIKALALLLALFSTLNVQLSTVHAQGTAFTYQGRLNDGGQPATGIYDLRFTIYDSVSAGTFVAGPQTNSATGVSNGLFTVTLDFGSVFDGNPRWLEIGVRTNGSVLDYSTLTARQALTASPYAITAGNVTGPINGSSIVSGTITSTQLAPGTAAANLGSSGQSGVASGGVVLSANANSSDLLNAGYIRIGQATLGEIWQPRALSAEAPSPRYSHTAVWTGTEMIVWGGFDGSSLVAQADGGRYNPALNTWKPVANTNAPGPRYLHTAVWTGTEMIVWGGYSGFTGSTYWNDGSRYNPVLDTWTSVTTNNAPAGRNNHVAVWTGTEMIVWGGSNASGDRNDGGRYNPASGVWTALPTNGAPSIRAFSTALWTGSEMLVWGGQHFINSFNRPSYNDGGRYNPAGNTWTDIPTNNAPSPRHYHTAVWTGSEMIVWGGFDAALDNSGGRYNPVSDTWTPLPTNAAPTARSIHTAIWTGSEMIVWGGQPLSGNSINDGGRYQLASNSWVPLPAAKPSPRYFHGAVWTGNEMIVWGGSDGANYFNTGARYNPVSDNWTPTSLVNAPSGRQEFSTVWTGTEMIVWGGYNPTAILENTGGRYNPVIDQWTAVPTNGAPAARDRHTAVWTGNEMIVWGGENAGTTGGRYNPTLNTWTNTSTSGAPSARYYHSAVWTGSEMLVFGGRAGSTTTDGGGRYSPSSDTWQVLPSGAGPRQTHTAIWTGNEMIVWGGLRHDGGGDVYLNTGARYNPTNNTWTLTATNGAPFNGRWFHTALWTGSAMLVWGGEVGSIANPHFNDGGLYDPVSDSWFPTTTFQAPPVRSAHTAVWTGSSMLVFGGFSPTVTGTGLYSYTPAATIYLYQKP